ncbi:MAG: phosphoenolpyruvate carboxykinase (ATP) [Candidatus Amoebophilus sp. 36-38]|nr:MAG: phosphoenolpyruvate carboxykinase (ATP) [Candidatus Amoebophilus sp. 36-38]
MQGFNNSQCLGWLKETGLDTVKEIYWQLTIPELVEHTIRNSEGVLSAEGALVCHTGKFTGRSPQDKFIVEDKETKDTVWWGPINNAFDSQKFDALYKKAIDFLQDKKLYIRDAYVSALPEYRLSLRVITTQAWQNLFANHLFLRPSQEELSNFTPDFLIFQIPDFQAIPSIDGTRNANFTIINFTKKIILIGGTGYAGEMKKGAFTLLNYLSPLKHQVLPMHCAANVGPDGNTAIYFGLSGTGKTTLSADPNRRLIGDDEHGWYDQGIFNFEGGCYAKTINLTKESEPQIFDAIKFGTIIENMRFIPETRQINYKDASITENVRSAYPVEYIPDALIPSIGTIPKHIFFLSCDAYGVLPPIAKLDKDQAIHYFLSGYTAKVAGTEAGVTAPKAVFSTCFGAPFLPLHPTKYADILANKLEKHHPTVWLVNTGWIGGGYGIGNRIQLSYTRALVTAALSGELEKTGFSKDPIFNLSIPNACLGVPTTILNPSTTWNSLQAYELEAKKLLEAFASNFSVFLTNNNNQIPMG